MILLILFIMTKVVVVANLYLFFFKEKTTETGFFLVGPAVLGPNGPTFPQSAASPLSPQGSLNNVPTPK